MNPSRRELLAAGALLSAAPAWSAKLPALPVSIARCPSYAEDLTAVLRRQFDEIGGLGSLVKNKTVTVKLNLTGSPALRLQGKAPGLTHYTHPKMVGSVVALLHEAGAKRIRLVESCAGTAGPLLEYMLDAGWNVRQLQSAAPNILFENTNARGSFSGYAEVAVPGGGLVFPKYTLNRAFVETDVLVSMAKLKEHATCGVTLSMKNCFGNTPASIYGDDAGKDEPNEAPTKGRLKVCHFGERQPASIAAAERDPHSSRLPTERMPRITAELNAARPVDLAIIDGIETMTGGEGPWIKGAGMPPLNVVKPGLVVVGRNAVNVDAVGTKLMGFDPRAPQGVAPFANCPNTLLLAEALGLGSADLAQLDLRGAPLAESIFRFRA